MIWLIVLQLLAGLINEADLSWAAKQIGEDTVVVVSYPTGRGDPYRVCVVMSDQATGTEEARHCWAPKELRSEMDLWKDFTLKGHRLVVELTLNDHGVYRRYDAFPVPEEGMVVEMCHSDDCPF